MLRESSATFRKMTVTWKSIVSNTWVDD